MSRIFISFAHADQESVIGLSEWLRANGWDDFFMDLDPTRGILAGERWQQALLNASRRAELIIACISRSYLESKHSMAEVRAAEMLGKRVVGVLFEPIELGEISAVLPNHQIIALFATRDGTRNREFDRQGLARLAAFLRSAGLEAESFPIDPQRPPYRGLLPFEEKDAGIFFGREADIVRALDSLRLMHTRGGGLFLVVGAAGVGKTSFLQAGLLPRLKREISSAVLQVNPGGGSPIEEAIERCVRDQFRQNAAAAPPPFPSIEASFQAWQEMASRMEGRSLANDRFILVIDQIEQFIQSGSLWRVIDEYFRVFQNASLICTIRSGNLAQFQEHRSQIPGEQQLFSLEPVSPAAYREIILRPAQLAGGIKIDPQLVETIISDAGGGNALPAVEDLLMRLWDDYAVQGGLDSKQYHALGGLSGLYTHIFDELLNNDRLFDTSSRDERIQLVQSVFVPALVNITEDGRVTARNAVPDSFDSRQQRIVNELVERRLLTAKGGFDDSRSRLEIGVASEIILTQVPLLQSAIDRGYDAIRAIIAIRRDAAAWQHNRRLPDYLAHGERLRQMQSVLAASAFAGILDETERAYLTACETAAEVQDEYSITIETEIKLLNQSVVHMTRTLESMTAEYSDEEAKAIDQIRQCLVQIVSNIPAIHSVRKKRGPLQRLWRALTPN